MFVLVMIVAMTLQLLYINLSCMALTSIENIHCYCHLDRGQTDLSDVGEVVSLIDVSSIMIKIF